MGRCKRHYGSAPLEQAVDGGSHVPGAFPGLLRLDFIFPDQLFVLTTVAFHFAFARICGGSADVGYTCCFAVFFCILVYLLPGVAEGIGMFLGCFRDNIPLLLLLL